MAKKKNEIIRNGKEVVLIWIYKNDRDVINGMCERQQMSQADIIEKLVKDKEVKQ